MTGADRRLLAGVLQVRHLPPVFPWYERFSGFGLGEGEVDRIPIEARTLGGQLSKFPPAPLEWGATQALDEEQSDDPVGLGCVGPVDERTGYANLGMLSDVQESMREWATMHASALIPSWHKHERDFVVLLDACLSSRWLQYESEVGLSWLTPRTDECSAGVCEAAAGLARALSGRAVPILDDFVRQLVETRDRQAVFVSIPNTHGFRPFKIVRASASPDRLAELGQSVESFIRNQVETLNFLGDPPYARDVWLSHDEEGHVSVSEAAEAFADSLGQRATELAPEFVSGRYKIHVEALSPIDWHRYGNRRIRLALSPRDKDDSFDIAVVGSGIAVWSVLSLQEAMRQIEAEVSALVDERLAEVDVDDGPQADEESEDHEGKPVQPPSAGSRQALYLIDEPERHLHPKAQDEAAEWVATLSDGGAHVALATHALPFLSLPREDVEYALATRNPEGITETTSITGDVFGALDHWVEEAGLASRAQLLQVLRGVLIVEGAHDEQVVTHFYGADLSRARVLVLPVRGAKKARLLVEAELLRQFNVPMAILFDDISAGQLDAPEPPGRKDIAAYELWQLLNYWPETRPKPRVISFPLPDIFCALPDACVERAVRERGGSFPGWDRVVTEFRSSQADGFKPFFIGKAGLSKETDPSTLLSEILEACRTHPRRELVRAMNEALAFLTK